MTPLERCLYFTTAHAHLRSGCPTLALEVLSKLPDNVIDIDNPDNRGKKLAILKIIYFSTIVPTFLKNNKSKCCILSHKFIF